MLDDLLDNVGDPADKPAEEQQREQAHAESLGVMAILPLRGVLVYPLSALPLRVAQPRSIRL